MPRLLNAEIRKLWTIWSTYVIFGIVVVIDLAFGFGLASGPRRPTRGQRRHRSAWLFSVVRQRVLRARRLADCSHWFSALSSSRVSTGTRQ